MRWLLWYFCLLAGSYETINHYHYNIFQHWCRMRGRSAPPKHLIGWKSGQNLWGIWAKCVKTFAKSLYVLWFYKNSTPNESANVFLWMSCFYLVLFGQVRGNLGKFGENLGKNGAWSALIWKNVPNVKRNAVIFLEVIFFGIFFGHVWGIWANPSDPKNFACSYTYVFQHVM